MGPSARGRALRRPATWIGGLLVTAGLVLVELNWWFLLLSALGACGPGLLRELGWLRDEDEYQRRVAHRAGYQAFLVTAFAAFVVVAALRVHEGELRNPGEAATLLLSLMWVSWLLSSLVAYWGARKASVRLLLGFGLAWLAFALADAGPHPLGWLMASLPVLPFLLLAALVTRWPRLAGLLLVAAAVGLYILFGYYREDHMGGLIVNTQVAVLLCGPLLGCGLALLRQGRGEEEADSIPVTPPCDG